jgi:cytochrome c553
MKYRAVVTVLALAISHQVVAAEKQSEQSLGSQQQPYTPSLAVVMELIQLSHFKLWLAGNLRNWLLAEYELSQMKTTLQDARSLFPNVPQADTSAILQSAEEFRDAIKTKDGARFDGAFEKFTSACNSCHEAAGLGFIEIRIPRLSPIMTSPLSDQSFAPK